MNRSFFSAIALSVASLSAQEPQTQEIEVTGATSANVRWDTVTGRSYFLQYSTNLLNWHYFPLIERGDSSPLGYGFDSNSDKIFARLKYTDFPTLDPKTADFDSDGINNWDEIRMGGSGTEPFEYSTAGNGISDYFADSDGNGLADGWELNNFDHVGVADPHADDDSDGLTNKEEAELGTSASNSNSDGDDFLDGEDVDPLNGVLSWRKADEYNYALIDLGLPSNVNLSDGWTIRVSESGSVLLSREEEQTSWPTGPRPKGDFKTYVWDVETTSWVTLLMPDNLRGVGTAINSAGTAVYGLGYAAYGIDKQWPGTKLATLKWEKTTNGWQQAEAEHDTGLGDSFSNEDGTWAQWGTLMESSPILFGDTGRFVMEDGSIYGEESTYSNIFRLGTDIAGPMISIQSPSVDSTYITIDGGSGNGNEFHSAGEPSGWHAAAWEQTTNYPPDANGNVQTPLVEDKYVFSKLATNGSLTDFTPPTGDARKSISSISSIREDHLFESKGNAVIWQTPNSGTFVGTRSENTGQLTWNEYTQSDVSRKLAGTINEQGVALIGSTTIWRNGKRLPLAELITDDSFSSVSARDMSNNGMLVGIATKILNGDGTTIPAAQQNEHIILGAPSMIKQRVPNIANGGGATKYEYKVLQAVPRDQVYPYTKIIEHSIAGSTLTLQVDIYEALIDVLEGDVAYTPKVWVNSREIVPEAGDENGVYRLNGYQFQLYSGRNEVTVTVQNALGGTGSHTIVIEGSDSLGFEVSEEPEPIPTFPTYPVVYELQGLELSDTQKLKLNIGGKSVDVEQEDSLEPLKPNEFRTKAFLSILKPKTAEDSALAAIPGDKPLFLTELEDDMNVELTLEGSSKVMNWDVAQSGLELKSQKYIEIEESSDRSEEFEFLVRGMGAIPEFDVSLTNYRNDEVKLDVSDDFHSEYKKQFELLTVDEQEDSFSFVLTNSEIEDGYNKLVLQLSSNQAASCEESYHTFRFDSPSESRIRVFPGNTREEVVRDGVVGRPQDSYYSVESDTDLAALSESLSKSQCEIVGMIDINALFEEEPLKRSFLVRAPAGSVFPALDTLYISEGKAQRSQAYTAIGNSGIQLSSELTRVQNDSALPDSAKNALSLDIADSYQLLNAFEDNVPKSAPTHIDVGGGNIQPVSWTLRGTSLPNDVDSNPSAWIVQNTVNDDIKVFSDDGNINVNTTGAEFTYYSQTANDAPWDITGSRIVSQRFTIQEFDSTYGSQGAFQLELGDGLKTWTCQVGQIAITLNGVQYNLSTTDFPNGIETDTAYALKVVIADSGNNAAFYLNNTEIASVASNVGNLNGIAFGDPGAGIAGKVLFDELQFENTELAYEYGYFDSDIYAETDEIDDLNSMLLYMRSKGQAFRTSRIARWIKILDKNAYDWLIETYTGRTSSGVTKELHVITGEDVWLGDIVEESTDKEYQGWFWNSKLTKVSTRIQIDSEETQFWSIDKDRNEIQLAGILMGWVYNKHDYQVWLAQKSNSPVSSLNAYLLERKHFSDNINKWAKNTEDILLTGAEIAVSVTNEYADWAITIKDISQGEYMAVVGFIPLVPSAARKTMRIFDAGEEIEVFYQLSKKLDDFPAGKESFEDIANGGKKWLLDYDSIVANVDDAVAVQKARKLTTDDNIGVHNLSGKQLLSTFSNSSVTVFQTTEPLKVYRVYDSSKGSIGNYFAYTKPQSKSQVTSDLALGSDEIGSFANYDRFIEVEIPAGEYVYLGHAAKQGDKYLGGGTQVVIEDDLLNWIWDNHIFTPQVIPDY